MNLERLAQYELHNIGLHHQDLRLEPWNPRWRRLYSDEAHLVFDSVRDESLRLYHCGSSAVENLDSKPIIDILGSVSSLKYFDLKSNALDQIGYTSKGEFGIPGRRFFVLEDFEKTKAYVHLHIFEHGSLEIAKHLKLRNLLKTSQEAKNQYQELKRQLVSIQKIDRINYAPAKNAVIAKLLDDERFKGTAKKILIVVGASQGHKNTMEFVHEIYQGQNYEIIDLCNENLSGYSYLHRPDDIFQKTMKGMLHADVLVLATPVYWYAMSGIMKNFLDRFSNLLSGDEKILGEKLCGKELALCATGYDLTLPLGFEVPFSNTAIYFGMDYMGSSYRSVR